MKLIFYFYKFWQTHNFHALSVSFTHKISREEGEGCKDRDGRRLRGHNGFIRRKKCIPAPVSAPVPDPAEPPFVTVTE